MEIQEICVAHQSQMHEFVRDSDAHCDPHVPTKDALGSVRIDLRTRSQLTEREVTNFLLTREQRLEKGVGR